MRVREGKSYLECGFCLGFLSLGSTHWRTILGTSPGDGWLGGGPAAHLLLRLGHHFPVCGSQLCHQSLPTHGPWAKGRLLTRHISASLHPDVNSWLLTFGFQLHNVIPGYPKPDTDAMEPSYELVHTQMKTQEWDNSKVMPHMTATPPAIPGRMELRQHLHGSCRTAFRKQQIRG